MLLCFVDESFKGNFYGFAAVLADENTTKALTAGLNKIVRQAAVDWGIPQTAEIHGYPLFHGTDDWTGVSVRARIGIMQKVVDAITAADVTILMRAVHKGRLERRQANENYPVQFPPEQVCFQHILQRADFIARRQATHALIIADERGDRERHRERFAMYQTEGTPGVYMHTTLDRLLDTVHFAPSHHSRMLQASDILAFIYQRVRTVTESDPRAQAAMDKLWNTIESSGKVHDTGTWP